MMNANIINKRLLEESIFEHKKEKQAYWTKNVDCNMKFNFSFNNVI
jgi:hypothetical protein